MALNFDKYAAEGNMFLKEYAQEMDLAKEQMKAGRILASTLHALREIISFTESLQLIAQMPMFLKAVYVNGWNIKKNRPRIKSVEDFMGLVRKYNMPSSIKDFGSEDERLEQYINTTFLFLRKYVSFGEMEDIKSELPKKLKNLIYSKLMF